MAKALKMDGTTRKARKAKRATSELPFWCELAFVRAYQDGQAAAAGRAVRTLSYDSLTPWYTVAGYNAGRAGMDQKQAFIALQTACAANGFHRD